MVRRSEFDLNPAAGCTVRYDMWSGVGINVLRRADRARMCVELQFVSTAGIVDVHYLPDVQADQLRAALDALTRVDPPDADPEPGWERGEPKLHIVAQVIEDEDLTDDAEHGAGERSDADSDEAS